MTPTELTVLISGVAAILASPGFVSYINKRRTAPSVTDVAAMYREERDRLEKKVDALSVDHEKKMADLQAQWQAQREKDQIEIQRLRDEIDSLYRRLYQLAPSDQSRHASRLD